MKRRCVLARWLSPRSPPSQRPGHVWEPPGRFHLPGELPPDSSPGQSSVCQDERPAKATPLVAGVSAQLPPDVPGAPNWLLCGARGTGVQVQAPVCCSRHGTGEPSKCRADGIKGEGRSWRSGSGLELQRLFGQAPPVLIRQGRCCRWCSFEQRDMRAVLNPRLPQAPDSSGLLPEGGVHPRVSEGCSFDQVPEQHPADRWPLRADGLRLIPRTVDWLRWRGQTFWAQAA